MTETDIAIKTHFSINNSKSEKFSGIEEESVVMELYNTLKQEFLTNPQDGYAISLTD